MSALPSSGRWATAFHTASLLRPPNRQGTPLPLNQFIPVLYRRLHGWDLPLHIGVLGFNYLVPGLRRSGPALDTVWGTATTRGASAVGLPCFDLLTACGLVLRPRSWMLLRPLR